jgi:hypothetical protein
VLAAFLVATSNGCTSTQHFNIACPNPYSLTLFLFPVLSAIYQVPLTKCTSRGQTVIHLAAEQGRIEALQWLLSEECVAYKEMREIAKVAVTKRGLSALHLAAMNGHLIVCDYLVKPGIVGAVLGKDPEIDRRVVQISERTGHHDVAVFLISTFASLFTENSLKQKGGSTSGSAAEEDGHDETRHQQHHQQFDGGGVQRRVMLNPKLGMKFIAATRSGDVQKMEKIYAKMRNSCNLPAEHTLPISSPAVSLLTTSVPPLVIPLAMSTAATSSSSDPAGQTPQTPPKMMQRSFSSPGDPTPNASAPSVFDIFGISHDEASTIPLPGGSSGGGGGGGGAAAAPKAEVGKVALNDVLDLTSSVKSLLVDKERPSVATYSRAESADLLRKFQLMYPEASSTSKNIKSKKEKREEKKFKKAKEAEDVRDHDDEWQNDTMVRAQSFADRSTSSLSGEIFVNSRGEMTSLQLFDLDANGVGSPMSSPVPTMVPSSIDQQPPDLSIPGYHVDDSSGGEQAPSPLDWVANNGWTALMEAAHEGNQEVFYVNESIMQPFILSIQLVLMMMVFGFIELGLCLAHRTWCLIEYSIKKRVYGNTCSCETGELGFFFFFST